MKAYALISSGFVWLSAVSCLMVGNHVLRETPLGVLAQWFDRLPSPIAHLLYVMCWSHLLLGWLAPLVLGFKILFRRDPNSRRPIATPN